jgi:hypothetical protein
MSLRDRFFLPSDIVADLRWVRSHLLAADAPEDERSHGHVIGVDLMHRSPGRGRRPARDGIFCQKIFGPVEPYRCACGALNGETQAGARCDRCGVLCALPDLRDRRNGHVEVDGVLHPALVPALARTLRISSEEVRAIARAEAWLDGADVRPADELDADAPEDATGPRALRAALVRAGAEADLVEVAVTRAIPVPPPGTRPFIAGLGPCMVDPWIGPLNEAWLSLVLRANRQRRLVELAAPLIVLWSEQRAMQELFETIVQWTLTPPAPARVWPEPSAPAAPPLLIGAPGRLPEDV